jgi:HEAT repeat protein
LILLRDYLSGSWDPGPTPGVHERDIGDNTAAAVVAIAAAYPVAFLEVFEGDQFDANSFILDGLGQIDDPRATERLVRASTSRDWPVRMHAAIGLGRRESPIASDSLERLLGDLEYLVRYHALKSIARIGDTSMLAALRLMRPDSEHESELIDKTIAAIVDRAADNDPSG